MPYLEKYGIFGILNRMESDFEKPKFTPSSSPPPVEGEKRKGKGLNKSELVSIAFELGFIIALPILAFGLGGKWLDAKWGTDPWLTIAGILFAIFSTSVWIYRKFKNYF